MSDERPEIQQLTHDDAEAALDTLTVAFCRDPYIRWMVPDANTYMEWFPKFVRQYGLHGIDEGTAYHIDDCAGVALWYPPGFEMDEESLAEFFYETLPADKQADAWPAFGRIEQAHPDEPHWHLPFIGVDPPAQGQGYGSALVEHVTTNCDDEGHQAYLETGNPRNLSLYLRHGFELVDAIQVGDMPTLFAMVRHPRE